MWTRTPKRMFSRIEIGSGLGRWKTMPTDLRSSLSETSGVVDVLAQHRDAAGRGDVAVAFIDAVQAAQERRLAAAGGSDQRRDQARLDVQGNVLQGLEASVPQVQVPGLDAVIARVLAARVAISRTPR